MRNVNLNIFKFLESIDNFCLSLSNIGLEVSHQLSVISYQCQLFSPLSPAPIYWGVRSQKRLNKSSRADSINNNSSR
ncbi:MAG: hypothetical protein O9287_14500 [Microcystis sp. LE17-20D]|nr:hypothetical protein [Microcystis sp. LE17-20D]MCZ8067111.1 hypothetical protein [Microcystis sp. LE17-20D]MCZ8273857.1 hypothetical protein [Microcystis sp. LE19-4.1E]